MNKFKQSFDKIKLNDNEKEQLFNKIINKKKKYNLSTLFLKTALTLFFIFISIGGCYALVKIFEIDNKIKNLYDINEETAEQIDGNDINVKKEFNDVTINIIQTIAINKNIYVRVDITGKTDEVYLDTGILMKGSKIDEDKIKKTNMDDIFNYSSINPDEESYGLSLLDEDLKLKTVSYLLDYSYIKEVTYGKYSLRLYTTNNKYYDITFDLKENKTNKKAYAVKEEVYNHNDLILTTNKVTITPDSIIVNYNASDSKLLERSEIYGEYFESITYTTNDNYTDNLYLVSDYTKEDDGTYSTILGFRENFHNINTIASITINGNKINLKK